MRVRRRAEDGKKDRKVVDELISEKEAELEEAEAEFGQAKADYNELELEKTSKEKLQSNLYGAGAAGGAGDYRSEEEREERIKARKADLEAARTKEQRRLDELLVRIMYYMYLYT